MKRILSILLLLTLILSLAACGGKPASDPAETPAPTETPAVAETPAPTEAPLPPEIPMPALTRETMPRLDGSTSTAPLAVAVCTAVVGESEEEVSDLVQFHKTTASYLNLIHGEADLLIVGEANDEVMKEKNKLGFQWLREPFATDAFVFVVNENNPVDSITVEQARKIYTGEITNWRELGGEDRPITALQRNEGAGSQTLMEKLVMQGEPMMEAPKDYIVATMGQLMTAVKSYDGSADAIGYSVYYYAEEMKMARGLKLLRLEGVEPNPDTIRSEEYPLVNPKYVVIPANAAEDAPNRQLYDWLLSPGGQRMIAEEGYVSVLPVEVTPKAVPLVGGRWYADYTDTLICRDDYGLLIPFAGQRLADDWPAHDGCKYGLMTRDGRVVADAVYSEVAAPMWYSRGAWKTFPLLLLRQGGDEGSRYAVAGPDGSWCTGFDYLAYRTNAVGVVLFRDDGLTLLCPDGSIETELSCAALGLSEEDWKEILNETYWGEGWGGERLENLLSLRWQGEDGVLCYDFSTGTTTTIYYEDWNALRERLYPWTEPEEPVILNADEIWDALLGDTAPHLLRTTKWNDAANTSDEYYFTEDGTPLPQFDLQAARWYQQVGLTGGLIEVLDLNSAAYYDLDTLECVFRTTLGYEAD